MELNKLCHQSQGCKMDQEIEDILQKDNWMTLSTSGITGFKMLKTGSKRMSYGRPISSSGFKPAIDDDDEVCGKIIKLISLTHQNH